MADLPADIMNTHSHIYEIYCSFTNIVLANQQEARRVKPANRKLNRKYSHNGMPNLECI
jgi:hypothetical protein